MQPKTVEIDDEQLRFYCSWAKTEELLDLATRNVNVALARYGAVLYIRVEGIDQYLWTVFGASHLS